MDITITVPDIHIHLHVELENEELIAKLLGLSSRIDSITSKSAQAIQTATDQK